MDLQNNQKKKILIKNTAFLYLLTFSTQLLALITVPYLTRVLGPVTYGRLGVALSLMTYAQLVLDFGFILSATELVSRFSENKNQLCTVFSSVTAIKLILGVLFGIILTIICGTVSSLKKDRTLYAIFYLAYLINSFLPDYLYRGKEQMKQITIRTVGIKIFFTGLIFFTIKSETDIILYPVLLLIGNLIAVFWSYYDIKNQYDVSFCIINRNDITSLLKRTFPFFVSRIASTFYQAANTLIVGILYPGQSVVGYYACADKMMSMVKSASSPIADSLYPYMMKNRDFKLIKKLMIIITPVILFGAGIGFVYAQPICVILFGEEYAGAANILRCLIPAMVVILPTFTICFPVLVPLGLSRYANISNVIGAILQICFLLVLWKTRNLNVYSVCIFSSISEIMVFVFRFSVAFGAYLKKRRIS